MSNVLIYFILYNSTYVLHLSLPNMNVIESIYLIDKNAKESIS